MTKHVLSRRTFLAVTTTAAGGLAIGVSFAQTPRGDAAAGAVISDAAATTPEVNAWVVIEPDDTILIRLQHAEMGQGISTGIPQIIAEELECDWNKVRVEYASPNRNAREKGVYGRMMTVGSMSVRMNYAAMQRAGANARARLIQAAAQRWKVDAAACSASAGKVIGPGGKSLRYGALAGDAAKVTLTGEPTIKAAKDFKLIGQPLKRVDTPVKLNGAAQYGIDVRVPGMVYAAMAMCPVPGGTPKSFDQTKVTGRRGVQNVVALPNCVAVVADSYWRAKQALAALPIEWDAGVGAGVSSATIDQEYRDAAKSAAMTVARNDGDTKAALAAGKVVEALYEVPHLAHSPMEPLNCTAHVQADRVDVWMGTQSPDNVLRMVATTAGVPPEQVYIHNCYLGGGFGRRSQTDEVVQAVLLSKAIGKPVKLVWSREDDTRQDNYRPQAAVAFKAALKDGKLTALEARTACGGLTMTRGKPALRAASDAAAIEGLSNLPYAIANQKIECALKNTHLPATYWRSVGASINAFVVEGFIDELAREAGADPYQFRRAMLMAHADWLGVLDMAAEKGNWGKPLPAGSGRGIAIAEAMGTIVAQVAEVTVSPRGELKIDRIVAAYDSGHIINPQLCEAQISGGIVYGLTAALYGEITVKDGAVEQSNFHNYPMVRLADCPPIEVHAALSGGSKWGGIGEPSVPTIAPALCNAIFAATGKRVRRLPLKHTNLSRA